MSQYILIGKHINSIIQSNLWFNNVKFFGMFNAIKIKVQSLKQLNHQFLNCQLLKQVLPVVICGEHANAKLFEINVEFSKKKSTKPINNVPIMYKPVN